MENTALIKTKTYQVVLIWVPFVAFILNGYYWLQVQNEQVFFYYLLLYPFIFSFILPTIAIRKFKFWKWHISDVHLALVWVGYVQLAMFVCGTLLSSSDSFMSAMHFIIAFVFTFTAFCVLVDVSCLHKGILEVYNRAHYKNLGPVNSVNSYAYFFFASIAVMFAFGMWFSYQMLVVEKIGAFWMYALGTAVVPASFHLFRFYALFRSLQLKQS